MEKVLNKEIKEFHLTFGRWSKASLVYNLSKNKQEEKHESEDLDTQGDSRRFESARVSELGERRG
jgi:hypothetical protein